MSTTVDQRVVEMNFDNRNFEQNVQTSLDTIDRLQQSLKFTGAAKGLEDVNSAAKNVNMGGLADAVETVKLKFSGLQVMAFTALQNITNQAVNAGKKIVSALTIDPIKTGFSEYETKINAIQTIMSNTASKGTTMEDVTRVIGELNKYADKTIYNFAEMTRNIGTFTAAGVGLEESAAAIQGIANLAAASGSSSQQASTAMYQLSQALSTGTVRLMDWNSVVNAGMGGEKFQNALKDTAREYGIAIDDIIKENGSFRESLSEGWLSADILNTTLRKFTVEGAQEYAKSMMESGKWTQEQADALMKEAQAMEDAATKVKTFTQLWDTLKESAQSGWGQTWEIIIGDFEEAKETLTEFSKVIGGIIEKSAEARNKLLQGWKDAGGRADLVDSVFNIFKGIQSIVEPIRDAFKEIFPPVTVETLKNLSNGLKELTAKFKLSDKASENLKRTFKGLFSIVEIVRHVFVEVLRAVGLVSGNVVDLGGGILDITATFGDWLVRLSEAIKKSGTFRTVLDALAKGINFLAEGVKNVIGIIAGTFSFVGDAASTVGDGVVNSIETIGDKLKDSGIVGIFKGIAAGLEVILAGLFSALGKIGEGLSKGLNAVGISSIADFVKLLVAGGLGAAIIRFVNKLSNALDGFDEGGGKIKEVFGAFQGVLEGYQTSLKADALLKIAAAIAILVGSLAIVSTIDSDKLIQAVAAIAALFACLVASFAIINKTARKMSRVVKSVSVIMAMAASILILAIALKHIADLDFASLMRGLLGVAALMGLMTGMAKVMHTDGKKVIQSASQLVIMSAAILLMTVPLKQIAELNWEQLAIGLIGLTAVIVELTLMAKLFESNGEEVVRGALQIVVMAGAITMLAASLKMVASLSWSELLIGILGIAAAFGGMIGMAKAFTSGEGAKTVKSAGQIIVMAGAIAILAASMKLLSTISWEGLAKGIIGAAVAVGLFIALGAVLSKVQGEFMKAAGALLIMSIALGIFGASLMIFEHVSWESIIKAIVGTAAALLVLVGIGALITATGIGLPILAAVAALLALIGLSAGLAGIGLAAAAAGISSLAASSAYAATAFVQAANGIIDFILAIATALPTILTKFVESLAVMAPVLIKSIVKIIELCLAGVRECVPEFVNTLIYLIDETLTQLNAYGPQIIDKLLTFIGIIIDGLAEKAPKLLSSFAKLLSAVIDCLTDAMGSLNPDSLMKAVTSVALIVTLVKTLRYLSVADVVAATQGLIAAGLFIAELAGVLAAIGILAQLPGLNWLIEKGGNLLEKVGNAIGKFVGGIAGGIAEGASASLPRIGANLSEFMKNVRPFIEGVSEADSSVLTGVGVITAAILALTGSSIITSLSALLTGGSSIAKIGAELLIFGLCIKGFSTAVSGIDIQAVKAATNAAKGLADMAQHIPGVLGIQQLFTGTQSISLFGAELVALGNGIAGFSDAVTGIDSWSVNAAVDAAKGLAELANSLPNASGLEQFFTGFKSFESFSYDLVLLGATLASFSEATLGIDADAMSTATEAVKSFADIANILPEIGVKQFFTGTKSLGRLGLELVPLALGLVAFSKASEGIKDECITAATDAVKALAEAASILSNDEKNIWDFLSGGFNNKMADLVVFVTEMVTLMSVVGTLAYASSEIPTDGLKPMTDAVKALAEAASILASDEKGLWDFLSGGVNNKMTDAVVFVTDMGALAAAVTWLAYASSEIPTDGLKPMTDAVKALAEIANTIPEIGIKQLFTGVRSLGLFGVELVALAEGLRQLSSAAENINLDNISLVAEAVKVLAEAANVLPEIGMKQFFTGFKSLGNLGQQLVPLTLGLREFSGEAALIDVDAVKNVAESLKALAEAANVLPEIGMKQFFTGFKSLSSLGGELPYLGAGLVAFSNSVAGLDEAAITRIKNAGLAAKALAEMASCLPNSGGIKSWFVGDYSIARMANDLPDLGTGLASFSNSVVGIDVTSVKAAASAAKSLAEMTSYLPNEGGIKAWFTGEVSVANFADKLPTLGTGLSKFSTAVTDIDTAKIKAASDAAKTLSEMTTYIPDKKGIMAWLTGEDSVVNFANKLPALGTGLSKFSASVADIDTAKIKAAASAAKTLAEMAKTAPENSSKLVSFGENLKLFSGNMTSYFAATSGITEESITASNKAINAVKTASGVNHSALSSVATSIGKLVDAMREMSKVSSNSVDGFVSALNKLAKTNISDFVSKYEKLKTDMSKLGKSIMDAFIDAVEGKNSSVIKTAKAAADAFKGGIEDKQSAIEDVFRGVLDKSIAILEDGYQDFFSAGSYLALGFANGISASSFKAAAKARAMAKAAAEAAEDELDIHSPSRVSYGIGTYFGKGFINALSDYADKSYDAGSEIAASARDGLNSAIHKINDLISSDVESSPTIRPVLDLSSVKSGAGAIGELLSANSSVGVRASLSGISSAMNSRVQNGANGDVISAIDKLRKELGNVGNTTYTINGVTYDDGSNVANAVGALIRAAKIERRM